MFELNKIKVDQISAQRIVNMITSSTGHKSVKVKLYDYENRVKPNIFESIFQHLFGMTTRKNLLGFADTEKRVISLWKGGHEADTLLHELSHIITDDDTNCNSCHGHCHHWEHNFHSLVKVFNSIYPLLVKEIKR